MRACFLGQNIYVLGNGIAVLSSGWRELEPARPSVLKPSEKVKPKKNRDSAIKPNQNSAN
jgi:hypothetical protein